MTSKEKVFEAINNGLDKGYPLFLPYIRLVMRNRWKEITNVPWEVIYTQNLELKFKALCDLQKQIPTDFVCGFMIPTREERAALRVAQEGTEKYLMNELSGRKMKIVPYPPGGFSQHQPESIKIKSFNDIEKVIEIKEVNVNDGPMDLIIRLREHFPDHFLYYTLVGPFYNTFKFLGTQNTLEKMVLEPEFVKAVLERVTKSLIVLLKGLKGIGIDGVYVDDEYVSRDMISREYFHLFVKPYHIKLRKAINKLGISIAFCKLGGDMSDRISDFLDIGYQTIQFEEPMKGYDADIEDIARTVKGHCALFGNIHAVEGFGEGEESLMRDILDKHLSAARNIRKFVFATGSPINPLTPLSKIQSFIRMYKKIIQ